MLSKRKLLYLVGNKLVCGWDDPRLLTLSGLRRRGFTRRAINAFCDHIGVTRNENTLDFSLLEHFVRKDLNEVAPRGFCVADPLKVIISNMKDDSTITVSAPDFPVDKHSATHTIPLCKVFYLDRNDFRTTDSSVSGGL